MDVRLLSTGGLVAVALLVTACSGGAAAPAPPPAPAAPAAAPASGAAAASVPAAPAAPPRQEIVKMSPGVSGVAYAPLFIGRERGYFREEGIEFEDASLGNNVLAQLIPALAAGQVDVAGGAPAAGLFNAIAQGINVRVALDMTTATPGNETNGMIACKELVDSGRLRQASDLRGLRVAIPTKGSITERMLDAVLGSGGLTLEDVDRTEIPYQDMNIALANNILDAGVSTEPFATIGINGGYAVRWKHWSEALPNDAVAIVLFSQGFADDRTDAANRFAKAWVRGARDFHEARTKGVNREEVIAILQQYTALKERALYDTMPWAAINPNGRVNGEALAAQQDWFVAHGYLPRPVDLTPVLDYRFADNAVAQLGVYRE